MTTYHESSPTLLTGEITRTQPVDGIERLSPIWPRLRREDAAGVSVANSAEDSVSSTFPDFNDRSTFPASPLANRPRLHAKEARLQIQRKWMGEVLSCSDAGFTVRFDDGAPGGRAFEADFSTMELSPEDQSILREGLPIVWMIGYEDTGRYRERKSILYILRTPAPDLLERESALEKFTAAVGQVFATNGTAGR